MRWKVAYMPGVKEHDIPNATRAYQEALVHNLGEMVRQKNPRGEELRGENLAGYYKAHIARPEDLRKFHENKSKGRRAGFGVGAEGSYRLVYKKTEIRGEPTLLIAAFGPRKNHQVYDTAEQRIAERAQAQQRRSQALSGGAPSAQARQSLPRSPGPPQGPPQASGAAHRPGPRPPRL